ncbi:MAG: hypothetical protein RR769_06170, partial [Anaerovoracaceae bacterium]
MKHNIFLAITGAVFLFVLVSVFIANLIIPDKEFSEEENRMLQKSPEFSVANYIDGRFEGKLENYCDDQFLLRNTFIRVKTSFDRSMGKVESNGVFLGKDKYLIENISVPDKEWMKNTTSSLDKFRKKYPQIRMSFLLAALAYQCSASY